MRARFAALAALAAVAAFVATAGAACTGGGRGMTDALRSSASSPPDPFATPGGAGAAASTSASESSTSRTTGRPRGSLVVGECFDSSTFSAGVPIDPATITLRLCAGPHQHEVYVVLDYPGQRGAPYPGDATLAAYANDRCIGAFTDYVGTPYQQSTLDYSTVEPTASTWSTGDRQVACVLHDADFIALTGSMQGARR